MLVVAGPLPRTSQKAAERKEVSKKLLVQLLFGVRQID
jgi:hypothetical protein